MPAAWSASGTLLGSTGADITPVQPAGELVGDIYILLASSRVVTETLATPSGWTALAGPIDVTAWRTYAYWIRIAGAISNPLCDWSAAVGEKYGQIHRVRGAIQTGSPFAASGLAADLTDPIAVAGVTATLANQLVIAAGIGSDNASASTTVTCANAPTAFTQRHFSTITTGADATGSFHDQTRTTASATGTVTSDHNSTMPAMAILVAAILDQDLPMNNQQRRTVLQGMNRAAHW